MVRLSLVGCEHPHVLPGEPPTYLLSGGDGVVGVQRCAIWLTRSARDGQNQMGFTAGQVIEPDGFACQRTLTPGLSLKLTRTFPARS